MRPMSGCSKDGTKNNQDSREHKCSFSAYSVADETNHYLTDDGT